MGDRSIFSPDGGFGPFGRPDVAAQTYRLGGQTFYVNANAAGDDDKNSPFPEVDEVLCFSTLQLAIDATVADRGDTIIVKRGYTAITTGVNFNKQGIRVIGQDFGMPPIFIGEYFAQDCSATDGPAATISKPCYIEGLGFKSAWTGGISSNILIDFASGDSGWIHLKHVRLMNWNTATVYGINSEAGANMLIEECSFEGGETQDFTAGIAFGGSATNNPIHNQVKGCIFANCTYGIEHKDGTPQHCYYGPGNVTMDSKFLNTKAAACDGIIFGNYFDTAPGALTFDRTAAQLETQGISVVGNEYATEDPGPT